MILIHYILLHMNAKTGCHKRSVRGRRLATQSSSNLGSLDAQISPVGVFRSDVVFRGECRLTPFFYLFDSSTATQWLNRSIGFGSFILFSKNPIFSGFRYWYWFSFTLWCIHSLKVLWSALRGWWVAPGSDPVFSAPCWTAFYLRATDFQCDVLWRWIATIHLFFFGRIRTGTRSITSNCTLKHKTRLFFIFPCNIRVIT